MGLFKFGQAVNLQDLIDRGLLSAKGGRPFLLRCDPASV